MSINTTRFSDAEVALLRFLKAEYLRNPMQTAKDCPESRSIVDRFSLGKDAYYAIMARFEDFGWVSLGARGCGDEFVKVNPGIVEIVEQLANPPPPDYLEIAKKLTFSKTWLVIPGIVLLIVLPWCIVIIQMLKTLLEWFGVK